MACECEAVLYCGAQCQRSAFNDHSMHCTAWIEARLDAIKRQMGNDAPLVGDSMVYLARQYLEHGERARRNRAVELLREALRIRRLSGESGGDGSLPTYQLLQLLGSVLGDQGKWSPDSAKEGLQYLQEAIGMCRDGGGAAEASLPLLLVIRADLEDLIGRFEGREGEGVGSLQQALTTLQTLPERDEQTDDLEATIVSQMAAMGVSRRQGACSCCGCCCQRCCS